MRRAAVLFAFAAGCAGPDAGGPPFVVGRDAPRLESAPRDGIDPACRACHPTHEATQEVAAKRSVLLASKRLDEIVCTDCHGSHRLAVRTVRWDRRTGRLIRAGRGRS